MVEGEVAYDDLCTIFEDPLIDDYVVEEKDVVEFVSNNAPEN